MQLGRQWSTGPHLRATTRRGREPRRGASYGARSLAAAALLASALACAAARPPPPPPPAPLPPAAAAAPEPPRIDAAAELEQAREARRAGRLAEARQHLAAAVGADPEAGEARLDLVELLIDDGAELDRAGGLLREAQFLRPDAARFARLCGQLAELRGDPAAAAEAYRSALEAAPDLELRLRRGVILARLTRASEAEGELTRVVVERPEERAARAALAELYERDGQRDLAEHQLAVLAALAPSEPAPVHGLAGFYRRIGEAHHAAAAELRARALEGDGRKLRPLLPARR